MVIKMPTSHTFTVFTGACTHVHIHTSHVPTPCTYLMHAYTTHMCAPINTHIMFNTHPLRRPFLCFLPPTKKTFFIHDILEIFYAAIQNSFIQEISTTGHVHLKPSYF